MESPLPVFKHVLQGVTLCVLLKDTTWHPEWGSNPGSLDLEFDAVPPGHLDPSTVELLSLMSHKQLRSYGDVNSYVSSESLEKTRNSIQRKWPFY